MGKPLRPETEEKNKSPWKVCDQCHETIQRNTPRCRCTACHDSGMVFMIECPIVGYTDLMLNTAPCTCPAGDQWKAEYTIFWAERGKAITATSTAPTPAPPAAPAPHVAPECATCNGHGIFQGPDFYWSFCAECPAGDRRRVEEPGVIEETNEAVRKIQRLSHVVPIHVVPIKIR
jgi:hypothetical protein